MHFIALCSKYPQFSFVVSALRAGGLQSAVVRFEHGLLDTRNAGYTPAQAEAVHAALARMRHSPPLYGEHIIVRFPDKDKKENQKS